MNSEDIDETVNTLKEIQTEIEKMTDATELTTAIANKADKVVNATEGNFAGLDANGNLVDSGKKAADFATPADVKTVDDKFANYTTTTDLTTELGKKADTTALNKAVEDLEGEIEAAEGRAATDAKDKAD
jgi:hypothetical protein